MRAARRLGVVLAGVLLAVLLVAVALLAFVTGRALPQVNGTLHVAGLTGSVEVLRDRNGIVQIYADTPHDLFLAQGYVHAQERMWQMEVWRHVSAGRLAELFGPDQVKTDRFIRVLGWRTAAQADLDAASPQVRDALTAYTQGVNDWLNGHRGNLGLAYTVATARTGYVPEPWSVLDSVAWAKVQSWNLGGNFDVEVFRLLADERLGDPAKTDALIPPYPSDGPIIVPTAAASGAAPASAPVASAAPAPATPARSPSAPQPSAQTSSAAGTTPAPPLPAESTTDTADASPGVGPASPGPATLVGDATAWLDVADASREPSLVAGLDGGQGLAGDHGIGSNEWVVAPRLTATGHALLANDPHLGLGMPSLWFMNGLHCRKVSSACPFDVVGVSFPGVPAVVLGHNARIAWGATNAGPDVQDLFIEKVDPANSANYLFRDQSIPFRTRTETIKVAGGADVTFTVRETGHGPIVNDADPRLAGNPTLYALRWTSTVAPERTIDAILGLNTASNFDDFRAALSLYGSPAQNFVYADVDGHIGYQLPGMIPIRNDVSDLGDRPVPGWDGAHEWIGQIPFDGLPRLYDPPSGIIVTANNAIVDASYPRFIARDWDPGYRAGRILAVLGEETANGGKLTVDDAQRLQLDTLVPRAALIAPAFADAAPTTADGRTVQARIAAWDSRCDVDSAGCAAYMTTEYALLRFLFDDQLGPDLARDYVGTTASWQRLVVLMPDLRRTQPGILAAALDRAGAELRGALGGDNGWTWGRLHTITFREDTLGSSGIGPLEWYFDSGPYPVAGAAGAVDNTYYRIRRAYPDPTDPSYKPAGLRKTFEVTNGPSFRQVIDMGNVDGGRIVQTTGNSGNPYDAHYGDLVDDWLAGRLIPLPFERQSVVAASVSTLTLVP